MVVGDAAEKDDAKVNDRRKRERRERENIKRGSLVLGMSVSESVDECEFNLLDQVKSELVRWPTGRPTHRPITNILQTRKPVAGPSSEAALRDGLAGQVGECGLEGTASPGLNKIVSHKTA